MSVLCHFLFNQKFSFHNSFFSCCFETEPLFVLNISQMSPNFSLMFLIDIFLVKNHVLHSPNLRSA